jgi:hypothetical protein
MHRWIAILSGLAAAGLAIVLVAKGYTPPKGVVPPSPDAETDGGAVTMVDGGGDGAALGATATPEGDAGLFLSDLVVYDRGDAGAGTRLPDGTVIPPLPPNTPRQVRFGVVLVSYADAQPSPNGQAPNKRSKAEAKELAERLATEAQSDFHAAVQRGDVGSSDDVGHIRLGILEVAPEYVLFTLPVGGVSAPLETPRGYWIAKRLE